jgi:hypothetical protein
MRGGRAGEDSDLRDLDPQLPLGGLHVPGTEPVAQSCVVVAQAALALRPTLVASPTQPLIELVLDRPLNDQPGAEPSELAQHLLWSSTMPRPSSLSISACISADGGTVRLTA